VSGRRIGIDARELLGAKTGVGRYLGELLRRWLAFPDAGTRRFVLYTPEALTLPFPPALVEQRIGGRGSGTWWEQTWLRRAVRADRPDVFFAPAYTAPLRPGVPLAVTIHDLSFFAHPEWFRPREGLRRRWLTRAAAGAASVVLTDSEFSRAEIESHLGVDRRRLRVIPLGAPDAAIDAGNDRPRTPTVLFVGSLFNRRRLPDLITAFARATPDLPAARLVIVGEDRTFPRQDLAAVAAREGVGGRTEFRRYASDMDVRELYASAAAFAFLSEYEGFGLPPLEALSAGVPIVLLDTSIAREVFGPSATYVPRGDIAAAAAALRTLLTSPDGREPLRYRADVLARYSWDRAARATLEAIEGVESIEGR
jgi:glycosyltransferase involved in cell wall biosynthesis